METLIDKYGRPIRKLRLSVTDQCNLRCHYCMPEEGLQWLDKKMILSFEEIVKLSKIFLKLGIQHIRLTGGEPLMRKKIEKLIYQLNSLKPQGHKSIGLTTNGILLKNKLQSLHDAGLDHINVSLDTLDPKIFETITKRPLLNKVLEGIEAASEFFPEKIKINAVIQKNLNEQDIIPLVNYAIKHQCDLRFIEKMPLDAQGQWHIQEVLTGEQIKTKINSFFPLSPSPSRGSSPSENWLIKSTQRTIGFINSVTEPFCGQCDRVRLTADGALRNCLFATSETSLKSALREKAPDSVLIGLIRKNISNKWQGHKINQQGFERASRSISQVGG